MRYQVKLIEYEGELLTAKEIAVRSGLAPETVLERHRMGKPLRRLGRGGTRAPAKLFSFRGEMLTAKEIAKRLGASKAIVYARIKRGTSLDIPVCEAACVARRGGRRELLESGVHEIGSSNGENGLYWADDLEARVWHLHCGGDEFGECTLEEIGACWNFSRERVRQIEDGAFRKIRGMVARGDKDALEALSWFESRAEMRSSQPASHWERAEANSPGRF